MTTLTDGLRRRVSSGIEPELAQGGSVEFVESDFSSEHEFLFAFAVKMRADPGNPFVVRGSCFRIVFRQVTLVFAPTSETEEAEQLERKKTNRDHDRERNRILESKTRIDRDLGRLRICSGRRFGTFEPKGVMDRLGTVPREHREGFRDFLASRLDKPLVSN